MKNKFFAFLTSGVLLLNLAGSSIAGPRTKTRKAKPANELVALLPASDAVVAFDAKRFMNDALPKLLAANQPVLEGIMAKLDEVQQKAGIDIRQFDHLAAGFAFKPVTEKEVDFDPVIIVRGTLPAGGLVAMVKITSNGKYREEKIGDRTIYIFSAHDIAEQNAPKVSNSGVSKAIDRTIDGLTHEIALTTVDGSTFAFGSPERVRETVEAKTHVGPDLTNLLARKSAAIATFAAKLPGGTAKFLPLENDELGKTLDSIRLVAGSMDVAEGGVILQAMARTQTPEQAKSLMDTMQGLQMVGKALLGGAKGADKQLYARLLDGVKLAKINNEVSLDLQIPQADVDFLVGMIK
jgi:hypothetical protein